MKTPNLAYFVLGLGVLILLGIAWYFGMRKEPKAPAPETPIAEIPLSEGQAIYTNGEEGFLIAYPERAKVSETFSNAHLTSAWSVSTTLPGSALLEILTYTRSSDTSYPRYYDTLVRLGVSRDQAAVRACTDLGNGEAKGEDRVIGDTTWKSFTYQDAGMMKYVTATSYRTIHNGACYALEEIIAGSVYREGTSADDVPEEALRLEAQKLRDITETFRFAR